MLSDSSPSYGVLLPHFGAHAQRDSITVGARRAESLGFDALWARDHVVFQPHHHEGDDPTFLDPFVTLSAAASVTDRIALATGALIPHRHPILTALMLGSLERLAGAGRVIVGFGLGSFEHEFEIVGMGGWDRREVHREQVEIMRRLWRGVPVDHEGRFYSFKGAEVHPSPAGGDLPIWYSGTSLASVRRAVEYCEGWIPGRMPRHMFRSRVERLRAKAAEAERPMPTPGVIPYTSPGRSLAEATASFDLSGLIEEAGKRYRAPDGGEVSSLRDLDGAIIAGSPEAIAEEVRAYEDAGCLHFVFDLRLQFDRWLDALDMIGEGVLPLLRR